jgi:UDP-2-acetamido-2-deoxy-ribo-hexuluronate aminotransferase
MTNIKMVDLHKQYLHIKPDIDQAIESVLSSTAFIQGPQVKEFTESLKQFVRAENVITCGNGTDALQIAMMALGLMPGDEVIVPVHTYVATAEVVALLGLRLVFVDVDADTFNIDPEKIRQVITKRTKAIVPVHLYGQCAPMESILQIAKDYDLFVIEDAAQALGAQYIFRNGERKFAGTIGTIGTTSFFPSKNLGCFGDGGAIFTQDTNLAEKIRMIMNHGQKKKYHHDIIGVNSRLDTLQAAILDIKLKHLSSYEKKRNAVAKFYDDNLPEDLTKIPQRVPYSSHVFNQYTVKVQSNRRDDLQNFLASKGVPTMIYYPIALHLQPAYKQSTFGKGSFPVTEELSQCVLSLPIHTEMQDQELHFICNTIKEFRP